MASLNLYLTTFNCARTPIHVPYFAANLFNALSTGLPPDLVVLSLQELAPLSYAFVGGSLLEPYFAAFDEAVRQAVEQKFGNEQKYALLAARNVGMTGLMVFARKEVGKKVKWTESAGVGVGLWEMGNKGAVGIRLGIEAGEESEEAVLTFVAAHLAPVENAWVRRNEDWKNICENLVFERENALNRSKTTSRSQKAHQEQEGEEQEQEQEQEPLLPASSLSSDGPPPQATESKSTTQSSSTLLDPPTAFVFFAGDLNYRTSDIPPLEGDYKTWPQPVSDRSDPKHYSHFLSKDQLGREHQHGRVLQDFVEPQIDFPPTYKYSSAAQKAVTGTEPELVERSLADGRVVHTTVIHPRKEEERQWLWARHRVPSWCDRIFYSTPQSRMSESSGHLDVKVDSYTALPIQPTSDHRPVALSCSVPLEVSKQDAARIAPPGLEIRKDWKERGAVARRLEVMVGIAAYLGLTWEGEALLLGTVVGILGGWWVLSAFLSGGSGSV
jgi:hypothetical protein